MVTRRNMADCESLTTESKLRLILVYLYAINNRNPACHSNETTADLLLWLL